MKLLFNFVKLSIELFYAGSFGPCPGCNFILHLIENDS